MSRIRALLAGRGSAIALGTPGCVLAVATVVSLGMAVDGRDPLWAPTPLNLSEASGARDEGEVVRLIEGGADTSARYPVRPGFVFHKLALLTPLETAIAADDVMVVSELLHRDAPLDAARWTYLRCIAEGHEVPPLLDNLRPLQAQTDCSGVRPPWPLDD